MDPDLFESSIYLQFGGLDLNELSLKSFLPHITEYPTWGSASTQKGRSEMALAVRTLESFLCIFFHPSYLDTLRPLELLLEKGAQNRPLNDYADVYVWISIEQMLGNWSTDIRNTTDKVPPLGYPHINVNEPHLVSKRLRAYVEDLIIGADTVSNLSNRDRSKCWEIRPHNGFFSQNGSFRRYTYGKEQRNVKPENAGADEAVPVGKKK